MHCDTVRGTTIDSFVMHHEQLEPMCARLGGVVVLQHGNGYVQDAVNCAAVSNVPWYVRRLVSSIATSARVLLLHAV